MAVNWYQVKDDKATFMVSDHQETYYCRLDPQCYDLEEVSDAFAATYDFNDVDEPPKYGDIVLNTYVQNITTRKVARFAYEQSWFDPDEDEGEDEES